jgi:hypothetical protein
VTEGHEQNKFGRDCDIEGKINMENEGEKRAAL